MARIRLCFELVSPVIAVMWPPTHATAAADFGTADAAGGTIMQPEHSYSLHLSNCVLARLPSLQCISSLPSKPRQRQILCQGRQTLLTERGKNLARSEHSAPPGRV